MLPTKSGTFEWMRTGEEAFRRKIKAIDAARKSVLLETYIYTQSFIGEQIRSALVEACKRGVQVKVLVDAFGSIELSNTFWDPLRQVGGLFRWFNPLALGRWTFRDHRKLLICDEEMAVIGGFNIAPEYVGNGVTHGWCDHGLCLTGKLVPDCVNAFESMFDKAEQKHLPFTLLRKFKTDQPPKLEAEQMLLCSPGLGRNQFKTQLHKDLKKARNVQITTAYFLPNWRIRRALSRIVKNGGRVQILLGAKSDVPISQMAAHSLYQRLIRHGIEIYEYQPQVLHAKILLIDDAVYAGSSNLDTRSLLINYEIMARLTAPSVVSEAQSMFQDDLQHAVSITRETWAKSRSFWRKIKERWAYFFLARVDPFIVKQQIRNIRAQRIKSSKKGRG